MIPCFTPFYFVTPLTNSSDIIYFTTLSTNLHTALYVIDLFLLYLIDLCLLLPSFIFFFPFIIFLLFILKGKKKVNFNQKN